MDALNEKNSNWKPAEPIVEPIEESSLMGSVLEAAPGLCGCEECVDKEEVTQSPKTINARRQCQEESSQGQEARQERESSQEVKSQQQESSEEASQREDQDHGAHQEDGHVRGVHQEDGSSQAEGVSKVADLEFITSSVMRRGNRNKAVLIREQRERLNREGPMPIRGVIESTVEMCLKSWSNTGVE